MGPTEYELRSAELPGARRVLQAATQAMVGGDGSDVAGNGAVGGGSVTATAGGTAFAAGGCRAALLQDPFEELVRRLAVRIASGAATAARTKGKSGIDGDGRSEGAGVQGGGGFTEWGALLLRKEVRTLQQGLAAMMETDSLNAEFGPVNELVSNSERMVGPGDSG